jgi:hypothetical protein
MFLFPSSRDLSAYTWLLANLNLFQHLRRLSKAAPMLKAKVPAARPVVGLLCPAKGTC